MPPQKTVASFAEIRALLADLPGPDREAAAAAAEREGQLTKPPGALGRLEEFTSWLCAWQGKHPPSLDHPRVAVFAGNHGVAAQGVSAYPAAVTKQMVANFIAGGAAINQLCKALDADLRVHEMNLDRPTEDFTSGPAMSEEDCAHAIAYGMMAVEPGIDVLCLGEMGIANTASAAALCHALFGGQPRDWVGPGTGVVGEGLQRKIAAVGAGGKANPASLGDPLKALAALGGRELAAIAGAVLAARLARIPVVLDGYTSTAAAAVLHVLMPGLLDHCQVGHCSAEPAHAALCARIGKKPVLNLNMRLGEGTGAALAVMVMKGAVACHMGMATFAEAGVSGKDG